MGIEGIKNFRMERVIDTLEDARAVIDESIHKIMSIRTTRSIDRDTLNDIAYMLRTVDEEIGKVLKTDTIKITTDSLEAKKSDDKIKPLLEPVDMPPEAKKHWLEPGSEVGEITIKLGLLLRKAPLKVRECKWLSYFNELAVSTYFVCPFTEVEYSGPDKVIWRPEEKN